MKIISKTIKNRVFGLLGLLWFSWLPLTIYSVFFSPTQEYNEICILIFFFPLIVLFFVSILIAFLYAFYFIFHLILLGKVPEEFDDEY